MRLRSELWVKAYVRRVNITASAFVVRHGDDDGGQILIKVSRLDGTARLFAPAWAGLSETASERRFCERASGSEAEIDAIVRREQEFDSDLWLVEVEDREGRHHLDEWLISE